jgi:hypothetical protein
VVTARFWNPEEDGEALAAATAEAGAAVELAAELDAGAAAAGADELDVHPVTAIAASRPSPVSRAGATRVTVICASVKDSLQSMSAAAEYVRAQAGYPC